MQIRGLIVAAALLLLLGGGIWWSNKIKPDDAEKSSPKEAAPKIITTLESEIQQIEIRRKHGETTVVKRNAGGWEIVSPENLRGDKDAIQSVASLLGGLAADQLVDEKPADVAPFGLADPALKVIATKKDGRPVTLRVGDEVPTGSGNFAQLDGDPKVYTIPGWVKTGLDKTAKDLLDKRLLRFDSDKLARIEVSAKKTTAEFAKNSQNEWQIVKPQPFRADGWQVEDLVRRMKELKLDSLLSADDEKKNASAFASAPSIARVALTDNAATQTLDVHKTKDGKYYAKSSAVPGVHVVAKDTGDGLDRPASEFRNKKLFDFSFGEPTKIEYKDPSRSISLMKSAEKWMAGGKAMDSVSVQSLIDKLREISAISFPDAGFTTPVIEMTVVSSDGKRTEKVALSKTVLGRFIARRENEPAHYELDPKAVEDLQQTAAAVKEPAPPAKK